jgi:aminopeptidase N
MIVPLLRVGAGAVLALACVVPCSAAPFSFDTAPGRLPKDVVPRDYRIAIVPDVARRRFEGTEIVALDVRAPVATIRMDSLNDVVRDVRFDGARVRSVKSDDAAQLTTITLAHTARPGRHTLRFAYRGRIESEPRGLFVQRYTRADGSPGELLATQFESIDARRMFPGWDEPAFRATYLLSVTVPAAWATIGNMPVARRVVHGALATTTFARTPPMPSYLLAFAGGDLAAVSGQSGTTSLGVWAPRGSEEQGAYALAIARDTLADYNAYFGIAYPLPKLDSIAIPGGFPGAMENWGAITYESDTLLAGPATGLADRQQIYSFITHEMAHQWTGNLVTMGWWNDIWLNESFANWRSAAETDLRNPDWHWWENQDGDKEVAMDADARRSSHAIVPEHLDERMADAAFDAPITYAKGQAFVRMLEAYLGPDAFRSGLQRYLRAHAYGNATSTDLWNALRAATGVDVAPFARGWTQQPGFPLVSVHASCDPSGARTIALTQQRFLIGGGTDPERATWVIPLHVRAGFGDARLVVLHGAGASVAAGRCDEPLSVNAGGTGFYRVAYDPATLAVDTLAFAALPAAERIALLDDQWALASSGMAPLASYLALASAAGDERDERDERVWAQILGALDAIARAERGTPGEASYLAFARRIAAPLARRIGWDPIAGEPSADRALRPLVLERLGDWNDPSTLAEARARFKRIGGDAATLAEPDLRGVVLRLVARSADATTFDAIDAMARASTDPDEQTRLFDALMRVRDPDLAARALQIALSSEIPPALEGDRAGFVLAVADAYPGRVWPAFVAHSRALLAPLASTGPEFAAAAVPTTFWRAVPLPVIATWLNANLPTERTIGIPRGIETAEDLLVSTPRLIAGADAYVAGGRSGTSARISSSSGIASRNAPTMRGSKPKPDSFSICSTAMLTDAASRHGRREVSAEKVSATATTRAKSGIAMPCSPIG